MQSVNIGNTNLPYLAKGKGTPVIFVHGSLGDYRTWKSQVDFFARDYRVITYSRRYHYPNPAPPDTTDYSAALHAEDLATLIRELHLETVHIVAASYGAYTSLIMAARYPSLVRSLVLSEPPILPWLMDMEEGKPLYTHFLEHAWTPAREAFARGEMKHGTEYFIDGVMGRGAFKKIPASGQEILLQNAEELRLETIAENIFPSLTHDEVRSIGVPTLLLNGEASPRMFHLITDELAHLLPNARRAMIPRASHGMHGQNPTAYNALVREFLLHISDQ